MSRNLRFAIGFAALTLVVIVLLVTGLFRTLVVLPLLYAGWVVVQLFRAVPQPLLWAVIIFAGFLIALRSLPITLRRTKKPPAPELTGEGKVSQLTRWFQNATEGDYFRKRLLRGLLDVSLATKGYDDTINEAQIAQLLRKGDLGLPDDVRDHLLGGLRSEGTPGTDRSDLLQRKQVYDPPEIIHLIEHLEHELEIHDYDR